MDLHNSTCIMCGIAPAKFTSIVPDTGDFVRLRKPLCEHCANALGVYIESIIERVAAAHDEEILYSTARALEAEADRFIAYRSGEGIQSSVDELLETMGVKVG